MLYAVMALLTLFAVFLLYRGGVLVSRTVLIIAVLLSGAALAVRFFCMDYETLDYTVFLSRWIDFFRDNGGFSALNQPVGNYNVPYLYFLAALSYLDVSSLHLIKLLSVLFDLVLAYYAMRIVGLFALSPVRRLVAFFAVLFLPTVILNGAFWGQCDSIYTSFAVMSVYYALAGKPVRSVASIAVSFSFKLQAVFLIPVFLVFLFTKKIKVRHLAVFPAVYFIMVLPAVLVGRPLLDTILLYVKQAGSVGSGLNYNSPSIYAFFSSADGTAVPATLGIIAAFILTAIVITILFIRRKTSNNRALLAAALLFVVGIPLLLPHMHDRYFYMADVFSVILAVSVFRHIPLPFLVSFSSLLGYHAYLMKRYLLPMRYGTVALIIVTAVLFAELLFTPCERGGHFHTEERSL